MIRQYLAWLVLLLIVGVLLGVGTYVLLNQTMPRYTSVAQLRVQPSASVDSVEISDMQNQVQLDVIETFIQNEIIRLRSEEMLMATLDRTGVRRTQWFQEYGHDLPDARERLEEDHLRVGMIHGSTLINVAVSTRHEEDAAPILSELIDVYLQRIRQEYSLERDLIRDSFSAERDRWANEVEQLQRDLADFLRREDINTLESRFSEANITYQQFAAQRAELAMVLDQLREAYRVRQEQMQQEAFEPTPEQLVEIEQRPGIERLNAELRHYRRERDRLAARFGADHFSIRDLDNQIAATESERDREMDRMIREMEAARVEQSARDLAAVEAQMTAIEQRLREAGTRLTDFNERLTGYQQLEEQLEYATEKRENADELLDAIRRAGTRPDAVPVRRQVAPTTAEQTFPRVEIVVPGVTLLVVGLGVGLIFLREMLDQRVRSPQDVKLVAETELLGLVPDASEDPTGPGRIERVVAEDPTGLMAEAFRQVRTAILMKMDRRGYKTLVIAAAQAEGGASSITHNLAVSLALSGRKVLVVDANLRRPTQHTLIGDRPNDRGLVNYLRGQAALQELVLADVEPNLAVLPTGDTHQAAPELLDNPRFRTLLSEAEREYDLILIDAPPALLATDTQLLAKYVDALALVVRADQDKYGMIDRMIRQLDGQRADVLGLILNGVRPSAGGYLKRSFRDYYRYRSNSNGNGHSNGTPTPRRLSAPDAPEPETTRVP
ncbi:MAG: polysaccharide biosynthesis tyrosine autokinase [Phycisphaeraceae bacterium]